MKLITIHPFLKGAIIFGILLILFLLYRGCQYAKNKAAENISLKEVLDSIVVKSERDSMASVQREKDYEYSIQLANGQIDLISNQKTATEERLLATTQEAFTWKKKYESVKPDMDTSVTVVSNDFIEDCHQCFDQVEEKDQLIRLYVRENKELDSANKIKEQIQDRRIKQLGQERDAVRLTLNDCLSAAKRQQQTLQPRRKILLSISTIAVDRTYPTGVGMGFFYQDKLNRLFGAKMFGTNAGPVYMAEFAFPLSFKRK